MEWKGEVRTQRHVYRVLDTLDRSSIPSSVGIGPWRRGRLVCILISIFTGVRNGSRFGVTVLTLLVSSWLGLLGISLQCRSPCPGFGQAFVILWARGR